MQTQTQAHSPNLPNFQGNLGVSFQAATDSANYFTKEGKTYCTAVPNPNPQWALVSGKSWVVSNCYHPFK